MRTAILWTIILATFYFEIPGLAQELEIQGILPSSRTQSIAVEGDYAYLGIDALVDIYDITEPTTPQFVSQIFLTEQCVDIEVQNDLAFVLANGLWIVDVHDPFQPSILSAIHMNDSFTNLKVNGDYCCISAQQMGVYIYNVSDPSNPELVNVIDDYSENLFIVSDIVFSLGDHSSSEDAQPLRAYSVSDPLNPQLIGAITLPMDSNFLIIENGYAFCLDFDALKILIIEVSDPEHMQFVTEITLESKPRFAHVQGDFLYATALNFLYAVDISDLESIDMANVYVHDDFSFVSFAAAAQDNSLWIILDSCKF